MTDRADTTASADDINPEMIRGVLRRVDRIGWQQSHHLAVEMLDLSLDESCHLSALLRRYLQHADT